MVEYWTYKNKKIENINDMKIHEPKVWGFVYLLSLYDLKKGDLKYQYIGKKIYIVNVRKILAKNK